MVSVLEEAELKFKQTEQKANESGDKKKSTSLSKFK